MNNKPEKFKSFDKTQDKQSQEKPEKAFELSYEPFDPKVELELIKIQKSDKKTRAERLKTYKEELINQKEGIAKIQQDLEKQIRANPDISQKALMNLILFQASTYRLSKNQLDLFEETLDRYTERHQVIKEFQEKYPDDRELFKACFGKYPEGKIKLIKSPITIYFLCNNMKDYTWIYEEKIFEPENKREFKKSEIKSAKKTGGHVVHRCLIPSLNGLITAQNAAGILNKISPGTKSIFKHEEQHVIKNLFEEQLIITPAVEEFIYNPTLEKLTNYLRFLRKSWIESSTKNEILAFYKQEDCTLKDIKNTLLKSKKNGGLYDYYNDCKEDIEKRAEEKLTPEILKKNKERIKENFKQVFVKEYKQEITKALNAIKALKKMGKSRNEIIYLLITEPLSHWSKLVKRIKETKK